MQTSMHLFSSNLELAMIIFSTTRPLSITTKAKSNEKQLEFHVKRCNRSKMGERTQFMIGFARIGWRGWGGGSRGEGRDTGGPLGIWDGEVTISQCLHFSKPEFSPGCNFCFALLL